MIKNKENEKFLKNASPAVLEFLNGKELSGTQEIDIVYEVHKQLPGSILYLMDEDRNVWGFAPMNTDEWHKDWTFSFFGSAELLEPCSGDMPTRGIPGIQIKE